MMHSVHHDDSSDNSSDMFSPIHARRSSLHENTPETPTDSLPRLQDSSWIGARVSPIPSIDDDDDYDDEGLTAPYSRAIGATEKSSLIGRRIHPMWNDPISSSQVPSRKRSFASVWGRMVVGSTVSMLAIIGLHDVYLWYISYRRGIEPKYSLAWYIPWLGPSARILLRFGAYSPERCFVDGQYFRPITSLVVSTSVAEWLLIALAWWQLQKTTTGISDNAKTLWPFLYLLSAGLGQLWMAAFHTQGLSGCASWGTCGVLCAMGVSRPSHRFELFMTAIALVLVDLLQPTSSVFGAIGASFFGWSFYGVGLTPAFPAPGKVGARNKRWTNLNWLASLVVVVVWAIPIICIARNQ